MNFSTPDFSEYRVTDPVLLTKYRVLKERLRRLGSVLIGFSGGVDSTLLLGVARHVLGKSKAVGCLAVSPSLARRDYQDALRLAALMDVDLRIYEGKEFENPAYRANGADRCFHCKNDLFLHLRRFGESMGHPAILYGGNTDDLGDYRPGRKAALLYGALAPMAEAKLSKTEVRALSRAFELPTANKPAMPCLSSRIPYGSEVTPAKLAMVEAGETILADMGFREYRVRHEGETARIEVPLDQLMLFSDGTKLAALTQVLREKGFQRVAVDSNGFRSGNLNNAIPEEVKTQWDSL